uniref:Uncharacterized protein n=1 Tax=Salarias fasciatus TaxID=181472 RepID=A0A672JB20_SALFA
LFTLRKSYSLLFFLEKLSHSSLKKEKTCHNSITQILKRKTKSNQWHNESGKSCRFTTFRSS